jgi:hypothetical protein
VLHDLGEVADVYEPAAGRAAQEVVSLGGGLAVDALADDLAAAERKVGVRLGG